MYSTNHHKTLLIGIGNSGRNDDGLGWAFAEALEKSGHFNGEIQMRYQLQVEDAELISHYDRVIFVDAFRGGLPNGFSWKPCSIIRHFSFTTHELAPETVLFLCKNLYEKSLKAELLLIEGKDWELKIGLSEKAEENLQNAFGYFEKEEGRARPQLDAVCQLF